MLVLNGTYNGSAVILEKNPPIKECKVTVNFPDVSAVEQERRNSLKQILKYRGKNIWEGDIEEMRSPR